MMGILLHSLIQLRHCFSQRLSEEAPELLKDSFIRINSLAKVISHLKYDYVHV